MPAMNIASIVSQLKQERDKLDNAIRALEGVGNHRPRGSAKRKSQRLPSSGLEKGKGNVGRHGEQSRRVRVSYPEVARETPADAAAV
jgi:hypothetical protein